jgi:CrcB protein
MALLFFWVFVGGALGSVLREILSPVLLLEPLPSWLPTLLINVAASFVLGLLYAVRNHLHRHLLHLSAVGFCGGFSTFSHFTEEVVFLLESGHYIEALLLPTIAIFTALASAVSGEMIGRKMINAHKS